MDDPKEIQNLSLVWRGININITYKPKYFDAIAHLQIQSENKERLPMTETGYRSHFTQAADIEAYNSPVKYVKAWLDESAKSKAWKAYETNRQQLKLF